jgi:hypothetical protein
MPHTPKAGFVFALLVSLILFLLPFEGAHAVTLKGSHSCEEWQDIRVETATGKQAARLNEVTAKYWIVGYLSALAGVQADNLRNDPLKTTSNEQIYGSIDKYCADNPDKQLPDAIVALWLDIAKFKKAKR